ncbi:MAG: DUF4364 family protein [Ruminococcaceae bacterium]|nr:DUF4364 family protein [Oscillospiraceae bacterium]
MILKNWGVNMYSPIGSKKNVKIFVLYLMANINYPLDFITLNDIVMQTDYVMYLDLAEGFHEMVDDSLIAIVGENSDGDKLYAVTDRGQIVASELKSDILDSILDQSLASALRYLDFKRRGVKTEATTERLPDGKCIFRCSFKEKDVVLFKSEIIVDSVNRAERMKQNFNERPEAIYRGINALFAGNVNFLFN